MVDRQLPPEVRDLVIRHLHSMEEIEVLLLLEAEPAGLSAAEVARRLRLPSAELPAASIARLLGQRFISADDSSGGTRYAFAVTDARTRRAIDMLRTAYNERPVTLVRLVYNRPSAAQSFADAFRIGGSDE